MEPIYIAVICIASLIAFGLIALFLWFSNNVLAKSRYEITDKKIERELTLVHLSDLHGKRFGRGNKRLIKAVAAEKPDLIVITGDIIHKYRDRDIAVAEEVVKGLASVAPVFYVSGNHEMRSKKYRIFREKLADAGAKVLDNRAEDFAGVNIAGVNCADIKRGKYSELLQEGKFNLLLAHLPQYISRYSVAGYDLTLSGHAHGGQWRIPFTRVGFYSPGQGLFPKYTSGVHSCGNMRQVISRGLGNSQCPLRLFNRPEVVTIRLLPE